MPVLSVHDYNKLGKLAVTFNVLQYGLFYAVEILDRASDSIEIVCNIRNLNDVGDLIAERAKALKLKLAKVS